MVRSIDGIQESDKFVMGDCLLKEIQPRPPGRFGERRHFLRETNKGKKSKERECKNKAGRHSEFDSVSPRIYIRKTHSGGRDASTLILR